MNDEVTQDTQVNTEVSPALDEAITKELAEGTPVIEVEAEGGSTSAA